MPGAKKGNKELKGYHLTCLRAWYKGMQSCPNFETNREAVAKYHSAIARHIDKKYENMGTRKNHYSALVVTLRSLGRDKLAQKYSEKIIELANTIDGNTEATQSMSRRERESWMSHEELVALLGRLRKAWEGDRESLIRNLQYLAIAFYVMRPPLRLEPATLEIIDREQDIQKGHNYLIRRSQGTYTLLIQKDKVSGTYGPLCDEIEGGLAEAITESLEAFPRRFLFCELKNREKAMTPNWFSKFISRIEGRGLKASMLRSSFVTWIYNVPNIDLATKQRLACLMRHSTEAAELHYRKIDKPADISLYMD